MGAYVMSSAVITVPAGFDGGTFARCDAGDIASGGGFTTDGGPSMLDVYESRPEEAAEDAFAPSAYQVRAANNTADPHDLQAWVICLDTSP